MKRFARLAAAVALLVAWGCSRMPQGMPIPVMGYAEPPDSSAVAARAPAAPSTPAGTVVEDSGAALAQKLLVLPFRDRSKYKGPWDIYTHLARGLCDSLQSNRFFRVLPMDPALARLKGRELKGAIDPDRALQLGRELGADLVILGEIGDLSMKRFRATVPLGGYRSYQGVVDVNLRVLKAIDGRAAGEVVGEALEDSKRYGITNPAASVPLDREYYFLGEIPWGTPEFHQTLVGQAVGTCLHKLSAGLSDLIHPPSVSDTVSAPRIIDVDGLQAYINSGLADGVQNGDKFGVWDLGRELRDPQTNLVLGRALPRRVGVVQVEQVLNAHLSLVRILEGGESIAKEYSIRSE